MNATQYPQQPRPQHGYSSSHTSSVSVGPNLPSAFTSQPLLSDPPAQRPQPQPQPPTQQISTPGPSPRNPPPAFPVEDVSGSSASSSVKPKPSAPLSQNQILAQTHPWRIKVYNACLACRKKKIKCDGQPTCNRCERLGYECSYVEVPHTSKDKNKKKVSLESASSRATSQPSETRPESGTRDTSISLHASPELYTTTSTPASVQAQERTTSGSRASSSAASLRGKSRAVAEYTSRSSNRGATADVSFSASKGPSESEGSDRPYSAQRTSENSASGSGSPQSTAGAARMSQSKSLPAFVLDYNSSFPDLFHILIKAVAAAPAIPTFSGTGMGYTTPSVVNIQTGDPMPSSAFPDDAHQKFPLSSSPQSADLLVTNKNIIQYLVHVYFECFHPTWMIVDKKLFLSQLRDNNNPPDPLLLVAMCAAAAKYTGHEELCNVPGNMATVGDQFLFHARILLQERFDIPSLATVQALLILYWCNIHAGKASLRFMYIGMAIRMAQELGFNRPVDTQEQAMIGEREAQIRKTIWWTCYQADRWTSAALGKPMPPQWRKDMGAAFSISDRLGQDFGQDYPRPIQFHNSRYLLVCNVFKSGPILIQLVRVFTAITPT
ncbi:hypothetical protein BGZ73_003489 [Actinomortierella ambigua]|nr:hypothetical protein BGZ73_003489 [Actinomortierella ambigua]